MHPTPINPALMGILGKSKAVMNKVEATRPIKLSESVMQEPDNDEYESSQPTGFTMEQLQNSKLPESVKRIMMDKVVQTPIYSESDERELPSMSFNSKKPSTTKTSQPIRESVKGSDMITISKTQLAEMVSNLVNEKLLEYFTRNYNKTITETAVKKTLEMLVKEGKLTAKKKI